MATKNYFVGPQDGWVKIATNAAKASLRVSAFPHTHPFYIFGDPSATPVVNTDTGVLVCHKPFHVDNYTSGGNVEAFWVRVVSPFAGSIGKDGKVRFDVHTDGGTLP